MAPPGAVRTFGKYTSKVVICRNLRSATAGMSRRNLCTTTAVHYEVEVKWTLDLGPEMKASPVTTVLQLDRKPKPGEFNNSGVKHTFADSPHNTLHKPESEIHNLRYQGFYALPSEGHAGPLLTKLG